MAEKKKEKKILIVGESGGEGQIELDEIEYLNP